MGNKFVGIFCFCLCFLNIFGQNITVNKIPLLDQLPVSAIHRVFQDSEGYMWYGTVDGLCRDDGYHLKIFRSDQENPDLLASNHILTVTEDHENKIWFGTWKGGYILDKKDYAIRPLKDARLEGKKIIEMVTGNDGNVWVCIDGAVFRYDAEENLINEYPLNINGGLRTIHQIINDEKGNTYLSVWMHGVHKLNETNHTLELFTRSDPTGNINTHIIKDKNHPYYWMGTWGKGIVRVDPTAAPDSIYQVQSLPVNKKNQEDGVVIYMEQDDIHGYIWATSLTDLFVFKVTEQGTLEQIDTSPFLPQGNKMLNEIIKDKDGNLWVSAYDQASFIVNFRDNTIEEYPLPALRERIEGNPALVSVCKDDKGIFWLSQERIGLSLYSNEADRIVYFSECPDVSRMTSLDNVSQIQRSHKPGRIWVAPYTSQVYGMTQENMNIRLTDHIDLTSCTPNSGIVESLLEDNNNNLWIGTSIGLFVYQTRTKELELISDTLGIVSGIVEMTDGTIWVSTEGKGLFKIGADKSCSNYSVEREIRCLDATPDGKLWIGTEQGNVLLFDPRDSTMTDYSVASGMNGNKINKIILDSYGHLWIMTNQKLTEFNPGNGAFRNYLATDEWLLLNRFLPRSVYEDMDGTLYFGGIPGFISLRPTHHLESIPKQIKTNITDVEVMGKSIWLDSRTEKVTDTEIVIGPKDRNLSISFSSLDHRNAKKVRYAYRLKGADTEWVHIGDGRNSAFYNQLSKGRYIFEVKATDENGLWSNEITHLSIVRLPAFYETWWAYLIYILLTASLIWGMLYLYLQRLKHANEKKFTEEVTQMKLRYFTNISHDLLTPLTIISCVVDEMEPKEAEDRSRIGLLRSNVIRLKRLLQQVLDFRKVESGNMALHISYGELVGFVRDICDYGFSPLIKKKNIRFSFVPAMERLEGYFDFDKLDKVLFNLLSNAFKYTPDNKKVWVTLDSFEENGHLFARIKIGDDGVGIARNEQERIFTRFYNNNHHKEAGQSNGIGLSLVKEFIELHHGRLLLDSRQGHGSVFTVEIPIDKESYALEELATREIPELPASPEETDFESDGRQTLLLVEDNEELLQLMAGIFSRNYRVLIARNGREALEKIKENPLVDCVISDIMMPETDGLELCRQIKNDINTSHIIVILLTARTQTEDRLNSYKAGADDYIPKPFEVRVIKARLENLLLHRQKLQQEFRQHQGIEISTLEFTSMDEQLMKNALLVVEENLADPDLDVEMLAERLHMSRSTLSRKIKTVSGMTPHEFIRNIKMKHACRMLENKNTTISEVAMMSGYNDRKYFAACFKEEFGMTPSEYQKEHGR